ncbi:MAG: hypothetical protein Kow0062_09590 [Acidobacteriota bacterium]
MPHFLTTIARFVSPQDAFLVAGFLDSHGIPVVVLDSQTVSIHWLYSNAIGGVRVQVHVADARAARELLSARVLEQASRDVRAMADACPRCGSHETELRRKRYDLGFLAWLLNGYPVWRPPILLRCRKCQTESDE